MSTPPRDFAHRTAVEVYGSFLDECVVARVAEDRVGKVSERAAGKVDGRPVRLVTISGKGGWAADPILAARWAKNDNVSLLDHLLSVARGALMFWLADAPRPWSSTADLAELERLAHAVVCIAFLHDIDKDLELRRGAALSAAAVAERMGRYGIDEYLRKRKIRISPEAMLNYVEEVEGTQSARSAAASDYDRRIAAACGYIELADKLEGTFTSREPGAGVDGVIASLRNPNRWPVLQDRTLAQWEKVEIHDHLHIFLLDRFQHALSVTCQQVTGRLPLIEIVHDGRLLCVIPRQQADSIKMQALDLFLEEFAGGLRFSVNNRLACEFVGGAASWSACRKVMEHTADWRRRFASLLALPRSFARERRTEIDDLFAAAGMATSWSPLDTGVGATVRPALDHPGGDAGDLDMQPAHALVFLVISLNHADSTRTSKSAAPNADVREQELLDLLKAEGKEPPTVVAAAPAKDGRTRRVLLAMWTIAVVWRLAEDDPDEAQELLDRIAGGLGLIGRWLEGAGDRRGLADQIKDESGDITGALSTRFATHLAASAAQPFDHEAVVKHCILCNEPVDASRIVKTASRAHGIKASAFSGRDGRNDHLAASSGDTHLCPVCLSELQLRRQAQEAFKGSGELPPFISSPASTGLFGGLAFEGEDASVSMGLHDLNRMDFKKGRVYEGLDCHRKRIRIARLETLPNRDAELVVRLRLILNAIRRLGRPIHIFRGAPRRHPAVFHIDALPAWLERLLGGDSLRIEQLAGALDDLELFENMANAPGLGIEWAKRLADPSSAVRLGALCVAWALAVDQSGDRPYAWLDIEMGTRLRALALIRNIGGEFMSLKDSQDPLIRLAWYASRIQKRRSTRDAANKQLLCWKTAMDFYPRAEQSVTRDQTALILGLAGMLEEELTRKGDAGAKKYRDEEPLSKACIEFARHFATAVWEKVFKRKEPTSQEQRQAANIYRFALLETYRERGIPEADQTGADEEDSAEQPELTLLLQGDDE